MMETKTLESADTKTPLFVEVVNMQGLQPICDPKSSCFRKLFWVMVVLSALTFTAFNITSQIMHYLTYPITVNMDIKRANKLPFPSVTICNLNFIRKTTAENTHEAIPFIVKLMKPLAFNSFNVTPNYTGMNFPSSHYPGIWEKFYADHGHNVPDSLIQVAIHPHGVPPILSEKGISVSAGFHNPLAVNVKKLQNADKSVSKCGSKVLERYPDKPYSIQACRQECMTGYVEGKCGCREIFMPGNDTLICDPPELYSCVYPTIDKYVKSGNKTCEKSCPEPCSTFLYDTTPSAAPLSDNFLVEYSNFRGGNASYWQKNFVELEIYLTSMSYEYIEKNLAYSIMDLLCDVGGALGLLLGASFLTLLEIMDFLVLRLRNAKAGGQAKIKEPGFKQRISATKDGNGSIDR